MPHPSGPAATVGNASAPARTARAEARVVPVGGATGATVFHVCRDPPPNRATDAEGQAHDGGDGDPERRSAHDVERVVGADVDPTDHDPEHDRPRHQAPPAREERRDHPGQPGHQHGVTGDEALAGGRHVAAEVHVGTDRRARPFPARRPP